ncbi:hypothetical protein EDB84DRAFT_1228342, partial [Lactarius hengduanensis]
QEAADRAHKHIRNIQDYLAIRRDTTASKPCFAVLEFDMNPPDEAFHHLVIGRERSWACGTMIGMTDL